MLCPCSTPLPPARQENLNWEGHCCAGYAQHPCVDCSGRRGEWSPPPPDQTPPRLCERGSAAAHNPEPSHAFQHVHTHAHTHTRDRASAQAHTHTNTGPSTTLADTPSTRNLAPVGDRAPEPHDGTAVVFAPAHGTQSHRTPSPRPTHLVALQLAGNMAPFSSSSRPGHMCTDLYLAQAPHPTSAAPGALSAAPNPRLNLTRCQTRPSPLLGPFRPCALGHSLSARTQSLRGCEERRKVS